MLFLLTGCSLLGSSNSIEGIWVFYVSPDASVDGDSGCEENYEDGECPSGGGGGTDSPWTFSNDVEADEDTFVAQVVGGTGRKTALMFWGGAVLDGVKNDAGSWVFTYENFRNQDSSQEHDDGYELTYKEESSTSQSLVLTASAGGNFDGELQANQDVSYRWTETDEWDPDEVGLYGTEIDSTWAYIGAENEPDDDDCDGNTCEFWLSGTSTVSAPVRGVLTDLRDVADFDALESYGDWDGLDTGF